VRAISSGGVESLGAGEDLVALPLLCSVNFVGAQYEIGYREWTMTWLF